MASEHSGSRQISRIFSAISFFTIYAKRALRERRIPFEINAPLPGIDPERLNWDAIREKTPEAERINGADPGMPTVEITHIIDGRSDYL